jgi:hypothetical protein
MKISIARLHGQACLVCGTTSDDLLPMTRRLLTIGSDGIFRTWSTVVCPSHIVARPHLSRLAIWDHDDERGEGMSGALDQDPKLTLIVVLCRELAKLGLNVGISDARPAAVVRARASSCVTVDDSQNYYQWQETSNRYPTADPADAAAHIAEAIKAKSLGSGERP